MNTQCKTPIAFIFYNRPEITKQVFEKICDQKPTKIYLISDGARPGKNEDNVVAELRDWVESRIDWCAEVHKIYASENMGCKNRIVSGLNEAFRNEDTMIVLEDDCLPNASFFEFCEKMLINYYDRTDVMMISGTNFLAGQYHMKNDYVLSNKPYIWGWATWKRAWNQYDINISDWPQVKENASFVKNCNNKLEYLEFARNLDLVCAGKIDTWDYQWMYCIIKQGGLTIIPKHNLIINCGFNLAIATHTIGRMPEYMKKAFDRTKEFESPIEFIDNLSRDKRYDKKYSNIKLMTRVEEFLIMSKPWTNVCEKFSNMLRLKKDTVSDKRKNN